MTKKQWKHENTHVLSFLCATVILWTTKQNNPHYGTARVSSSPCAGSSSSTCEDNTMRFYLDIWLNATGTSRSLTLASTFRPEPEVGFARVCVFISGQHGAHGGRCDRAPRRRGDHWSHRAERDGAGSRWVDTQPAAHLGAFTCGYHGQPERMLVYICF